MGIVYRALDEALGRQVALKVMLKSVAAIPALFDQFTREARSAAALSHPNIVQIYSLGEEKGQPFIVMELLLGGRFDQMIGQGRKLEEGFVLKTGAEVVEALRAAHAVGLIHDDIKPENILFDDNKTAKVADFGLARFRGLGPETGANEIWGTPYYIAPEKIKRQAPDFRSDMYSLGGTLFHALAGRPPFEGETAVEVIKARLKEPAPDIRQFRPEIRPETAALLARMLEADPAKRFSSYDELRQAFQRLRGEWAGMGGVEAPAPVTGLSPTGKRLIMKGKRVSLPATGPLPALPLESGTPSGTTQHVRRLPWRAIGLTLLVLALLGGIGTAGWGISRWYRERREARQRKEEVQRLQSEAETLYASYEGGVTGLLAEVNTLFFFDDEAAAVLREARRKMETMDPELASLALPPSFPTEGEIVRPFEETAFAAWPAVTNLEAMRGEAVILAQSLARPRSEISREEWERVRREYRRLETIDLESRALIPKIQAFLEKARGDLERSREWLTRADASIEAARKALERKKAEEEERRRREEEAERWRREEEERLARIEAERTRVREAVEAQRDRLRENAFAEAAEGLKRVLSSLQTEEGKAEAQKAIERVERMEALKRYLIEAIREKPLRWGWYTPAGSLVDISGASDRGIEVRGRTEPWSSVSVMQMIRFLDAYVKSEEAREKLGRRGIAPLQLAAAIYLYMQGERAYPLAQQYAAMARANDPRLAAEIARLLPDLKE